jgi:hypothetical protein
MSEVLQSASASIVDSHSWPSQQRLATFFDRQSSSPTSFDVLFCGEWPLEWPNSSWTFGRRAGRLGFKIGARGSGRETGEAVPDGMSFFVADFIRTTPIFFPEVLRIKAVL